MTSSNRDKLDRLFSILIRWKYSSYEGYAKCYTCPAILPYRSLQCGHFQSRQYMPVRWHEDNARAQCMDCNELHGGRQDTFDEELRAEIGDEAVDEIIHLSRHGEYPTDDEIVSKIGEITLRLKENGVSI